MASTKQTTPKTSSPCKQEISPTLNYCVEDSPVKVTLDWEICRDLTTPEASSFFNWLASYEINDLHITCLKTSRTFFITTKGTLSEKSRPFYGNWGILWNGKYWIHGILASPSEESVCSLPDLLEANPDPKYILSSVAREYIARRIGPAKSVSAGFGVNLISAPSRDTTIRGSPAPEKPTSSCEPKTDCSAGSLPSKPSACRASLTDGLP